jgi:hypothetical protein
MSADFMYRVVYRLRRWLEIIVVVMAADDFVTWWLS